MFFTALKFITSPVGKILSYILAILFAIITLAGLWKLHDHNVRMAALAEYNAKQMEQVVKDQQEFIATTKKLEQSRDELVRQLSEQNKRIDDVTNSANAALDAATKDADGKNIPDAPASKVLKNVFKSLNGE